MCHQILTHKMCLHLMCLLATQTTEQSDTPLMGQMSLYLWSEAIDIFRIKSVLLCKVVSVSGQSGSSMAGLPQGTLSLWFLVHVLEGSEMGIVVGRATLHL